MAELLSVIEVVNASKDGSRVNKAIADKCKNTLCDMDPAEVNQMRQMFTKLFKWIDKY